jgi:hypothetical protein
MFLLQPQHVSSHMESGFELDLQSIPGPPQLQQPAMDCDSVLSLSLRGEANRHRTLSLEFGALEDAVVSSPYDQLRVPAGWDVEAAPESFY